MSEPRFQSEPPRLVRDTGDAARVLAQAEREFRRGLDETAAFHRLERTRRRRAALLWLGTSAAVAAGFALLSSHGLGLRPAPERVELTAEVRRAPPPKPATGIAAPAEQGPASLEAAATLPGSTPNLAANSALRLPAEAASAPVTEAKCREWSAAGRTEKAIDCFRSVARGAGLEGEIALYEAARLTADGLHDPNRALALLAEYDKRFTGGAMRGEAAWLRIRAQRDSGRWDEALAGSEALLASPEGRALASELHWLRGRIYQENLHDCARAASELVALVGESGVRGDEAELRRARCLEQLGRTDDATAAYERYLTRPEPRRASEAKTRLTVLRP